MRIQIIFKVSNPYLEEIEFCSKIFIYLIPVLLHAANAISHIALSISYTYTSQCPTFAIALLVNARVMAASASRRPIRGYHIVIITDPRIPPRALGNILLFGRGRNSVMATSFEHFP